METSYEPLHSETAADVTQSFLQSLFGHFFVSGYYLDLKNERYAAIGQQQVYSARYGVENDWSLMDDYINECIHPDDRALLTKVSRMDYIRARLQKEDNYCVDVRDYGTGAEKWYRCTFLRGVDADHAGLCFVDVTELARSRSALQAANEEQSAQLEEIAALNAQLQENQSQLEEASSEQEAQIEEITALNAQLESNQAELEASVSEQEAQIEEITALNTQLESSRAELARSVAVISSLANTVQHLYYIDMSDYSFTEIGEGVRGIDEIIGREGDARAAMEAMCREIIAPEQEAEMRVFADLTTMNERLRDKDYIGIQFRSQRNKWSQGFFAAVGRGENGNCTGLLWAVRNIDDFKQRELRDRAVLQEYNDIMSNAGYGMWHILLKDGAAPRMQVNEKMAELLGIAGQNLSEEELYNAWYDNIMPEAIPSVQASVGEMLAGSFSENTYRWVHPAKGIIWVRCGGTAQKLTDGTNVLGGYHTDVTAIVAEERRHTEELERARRQADEERARVSDAYGMIEGLSHDYHTIWVVNKETTEMRLIRSTGVTTIQNAVQMGKDYPKFDVGFKAYIETYVEPEDRERMHREIAFAEIMRQLEKSNFYSVNYLRRDDSGHVGYHQIAFANADTADGKKQFVYGFRDIDSLVKQEQAQRQELMEAREAAEAANRAKTAFLFNMSHDIRTPMNAIMGFRELLEKHQEDPARREDYLRKIEDSCNVLLSIINNVLEMARIEKGTMKVEEEAWGAEQFSDSLYSVFQVMMEQKDITFTREVDVQHPYVYCDPVKVREIYINILGNAYKYTNEGGSVNMRLEEIPCSRAGWVMYRTTISDTGIGMSEEYLPHIFEEFSREHNTTDAKVEGTGLGMPIVKNLVEMLGGTIEVRSKKGEGSAFIVTLPHKIAESGAPELRAAPEAGQDSFAGRRILLAEDNELNAEIAMEILSEAGFAVDRAEDGKICLEMLQNAGPGHYDVILMDIQMPNMNGYEATKAIRALPDRRLADIKILAMTANAFEEDKREALRAGMNGHLAKPINVGALLKTLAELMA